MVTSTSTSTLTYKPNFTIPTSNSILSANYKQYLSWCEHNKPLSVITASINPIRRKRPPAITEGNILLYDPVIDGGEEKINIRTGIVYS